jgi:hypothetical protein
MPVAEKFKALGAGNGFPFCPFKINVLNYTKWCTLSGFNDESGGAPTQTQINDSHALAVKLYFNAYKLKVAFTGSDQSVDSENDMEGDFSTPIKRLKGIKPMSKLIDGGVGYYQESAYTLFDVRLCKMYKGDVSNEDNFIGYGFTEKAIELSLSDYDNSIAISGFGPALDQGPAQSTAYCSIPITNDSSSVAGVLFAYTRGVGYKSVDNNTAIEENYVNDNPNAPDTVLQIQSIELYTYPE